MRSRPSTPRSPLCPKGEAQGEGEGGRFEQQSVGPGITGIMHLDLTKRMLDMSLAVWGVLVVARFFDSRLSVVDRAGLQVALLGLCLSLAAADAALDCFRNRR